MASKLAHWRVKVSDGDRVVELQDFDDRSDAEEYFDMVHRNGGFGLIEDLWAGTVINRIKESGPSGVDWSILKQHATRAGIPTEWLEEIIETHMRDGVIYEPRIGLLVWTR